MKPSEQTATQILKTERLTLRQLQLRDDQQIFTLRSNKTVNKYLGRKASTSIDDARNFIRAILKNRSFYWGIAINGLDKLIGTVCLFNLADDQNQAEIGYELLPEYQGKGIMNDAITAVIDFAFHRLKVNAIQAHTHIDNKASSQLLKKLNFERCDVDEENIVLFRLMRNG